MEPLIGGAALFGIYATLAMDIASATNSSPQTTELFADERSGTLWKWVKIGGAVAIGFGVVGSILTRSIWPLLGVGSVAAVMWIMYKNALMSGRNRVARESNSNVIRVDFR